MLLLTVFLLLTAVLDQSLGEEEPEESEEEISGSGVSPEIQQEIIDKHNDIRRNVKPAASNMLKMHYAPRTIPGKCVNVETALMPMLANLDNTETTRNILLNRKSHVRAPWVWNEEIGERARKWAEQCKLRMSPQEERLSNDSFCGEIVFQANYVNSWSEVIDFWNGRKANFKYGTGAIDSKRNIYPYTQMIWYNSYKLGCAATYCPGTKSPYFYVCQYCPAGNYEDRIARPYKAGQSCGDCPNHCENKLCTNPCKHTDVSRDCKTMKKLFSCKKSMVKESCRATCYCKKSIV